MRVIAGTARHKILESPKRSARPLTDRIKTSVFDLLNEYLPGARVLDLFAGSGSFGIESLSRGADFAVFVDGSRESMEVIHRNLKVTEFEEKADVIRNFAESYLEKNEEPFDVIFLDPPFQMTPEEKLLHARLSIPNLNDEGILILRLPQKEDLPGALSYKKQRAELVYSKKYGISLVGFYRN